jgi:hypothetical protein
MKSDSRDPGSGTGFVGVGTADACPISPSTTSVIRDVSVQVSVVVVALALNV